MFVNNNFYLVYYCYLARVRKMTDCQGDGEGAKSPVELYEKLTAQGDKVRALKTAKAEKVSAC